MVILSLSEWSRYPMWLWLSLDCLCRWQVHVSIYCARRIPAHLRCTQCSMLLYLIHICFLPCICLWQISQILTCLYVVVGSGFVLTSPAFMRSSGSAWTQFALQLAKTAVTASPFVGCVVWSHFVTAIR